MHAFKAPNLGASTPFATVLCEIRAEGSVLPTSRAPRGSKQQSRRRYAANGFAFVPHPCRVLGQHSSGCRNWTVKVMRQTSPASLPLKEGRPPSDRVRLAPTQARSSCDLLITRAFDSWLRVGPLYRCAAPRGAIMAKRKKASKVQKRAKLRSSAKRGKARKAAKAAKATKPTVAKAKPKPAPAKKAARKVKQPIAPAVETPRSLGNLLGLKQRAWPSRRFLNFSTSTAGTPKISRSIAAGWVCANYVRNRWVCIDRRGGKVLRKPEGLRLVLSRRTDHTWIYERSVIVSARRQALAREDSVA
jgi:hypothetical protein